MNSGSPPKAKNMAPLEETKRGEIDVGKGKTEENEGSGELDRFPASLESEASGLVQLTRGIDLLSLSRKN